jgi:hypothetical protein
LYELANIKWCDITIQDAFLSIVIPRSKTDQFRQGSTVVVAKTRNVTCPYAMLLRFASMAQAELSAYEYIFGKLTFHR